MFRKGYVVIYSNGVMNVYFKGKLVERVVLNNGKRFKKDKYEYA